MKPTNTTGVHDLELSAVAWRRPHKDWGELVELLVLPEEGRVLLFRQSLKHARREGGVPWCDEDKPFHERSFQLSVAAELERRLGRFEVKWPVSRLILGGAELGLFAERSGIRLHVHWNSLQHGAFGPIGELYRWVFALSESD